MTSRYNGWRNYETWAAGLWLDNDEGTHPVLSRREIAQSALSRRIWPEVRKAAPRSENRMYSELLEVGLAEVDWYEVAILLMDQAVREEGGPAA